MELPSSDARYFDEEHETMPRERIAELQLERLLATVANAYEHSPLVRAAWRAAGVTPADITSIADFAEKAPLTSKDDVRRFRDQHADPFGGVLCIPPEQLTGISSTSGTTGDPTLVPERWGADAGGRRPGLMFRDFWELGARPGDHVTLFLFTFRGPVYGFVQALGAVPLLVDYDPDELERLLVLSRRYRPTALYNLGSTMFAALGAAADRAGVDPAEALSSYAGVVSAGERISRRTRALAAEWGVTIFEHGNVGDASACFECRAHDGMHTWEDEVIVEAIDPDTGRTIEEGATGGRPNGGPPNGGMPNGGISVESRCELVATSLVNPIAPLVRYRSDDLVRITREPCTCGRTHARVWILGRKTDEVVVDGRPVLPADVWDAVESVDTGGLGLFQVLRPAREVDQLTLRVGHGNVVAAARLDRVRDDVVSAVYEAVGLEARVELVPEAELLRLGPPHKIPRVTAR